MNERGRFQIQTYSVEVAGSFSEDVDYWLSVLRCRRWTLHLGGRDPRQPDWIAAHFAWEKCADVIVIRAEDSAIAYRAPADHDTDVLAPDWVTWVYAHNAVWTLRAVLTIAEPGAHTEPVQLMTAPAACRIPLHGRQPLTIRSLR